ncbi:hypothetical protein ACWC9T_12395 [Kitasatospora sp. NPDC001159]
MDGIPPERMVTDSWPALHGRPVLRRTVAVGLVLGISVAAALVVRGVNAFTADQVGRETDRDRAERLAGLHPSQHPGAGRYYVPVSTVYTRTSDGAPIAYLHYRLGGGKDPGLGDFLRTYDLPAPGPAAPLPPDLAAALGGDEPAEAPELPESPEPSSSATASPSAVASPSETTSAPVAIAAQLADGGSADPSADADASDEPSEPSAEPDAKAGAGEGSPSPAPAPPSTPTWTATPTPGWTPSAVPVHPAGARRIYVATIPGGLPGAADIYIRATG